MKYYFSREILFTHHIPRNARCYQKLGGILGVPGDSGSFGGSRETQGSLESLGFPWSWGLCSGSHFFAIPLISRTSFISFIIRSKHKKINKKVIFSIENYLLSQSMISSFYENSKHPSKNHFSIELS